MTDQPRGLIGGRPPAQDKQWGFLEARRRDAVDVQRGWLCTASPYLFNEAASFTANELQLQPVEYLVNDLTVDTASIRVFNPVAGTRGRAGIYVFNVSNRQFDLLQGSEILIGADAAGAVDTALGRPLTLFRNVLYVLGFVSHSDLPSWNALPGNSAFSHYMVTGVSGRLPPTVKKVHTSRVYGAQAGVVYYSAAIAGSVNA